jgi:hypothetical protein
LTVAENKRRHASAKPDVTGPILPPPEPPPSPKREPAPDTDSDV